jgi:hypothetical protein
VRAMILEDGKIKAQIENKTIIKEIFIPRRIYNIVLKS